MANRMLKQFAEMEQYDSEIAGGDECYLPVMVHFQVVINCYLKREMRVLRELLLLVSNTERVEQRKELFMGFIKYVVITKLHPDESKRDSLGSYTDNLVTP